MASNVGEVDILLLFSQQFCANLSGHGDRAGDELIAKARAGDPFPFIADRWPSLVITDPYEAKYFQGSIGDPENPCLRLDDWQRSDIIMPIFDDRYFSIVVKGNTKAGKGTAVAIAANVWFDIWDECKIIVTSNQADHAKKVLFAEICRWRKVMAKPGPGRILDKEILHTVQHYMTVSNPLTGEGFSGQHGPHTMFLVDESSAVNAARFDDAEKQARKIVALGNPRTLSGWFWGAFSDCMPRDTTQDVTTPMGKRRCVTVGGEQCMNVRHKRIEIPRAPCGGIEIDGQLFTEGERIPDDFWKKAKPLIPEQCDYGRFAGMLQHPDSRHVAVFAHGRFPTEDPERQVILPSWLDRHVKAWEAVKGAVPVTCFAFDAARSLDGDASVLAGGSDKGCAWLEAWKFDDTVYHVTKILELARNKAGIDLTKCRNPVCVDMIGLGAGVGDMLKSKGVWVIEYRGNDGSTVDPRTYCNLRAESYSLLGRRLNPDDQWGDEPWPIPFDMELQEDLTAPEKIVETRDALRYRLQPKEQVKLKLGGRSPDRGDTLVQLWHAVRLYNQIQHHIHSADGLSLVLWPQLPKKSESEPAPEPVKGNGSGGPRKTVTVKDRSREWWS